MAAKGATTAQSVVETRESIIEKIKARRDAQRAWLKREHAHVFEEQKHCDEPNGVPTVERVYWHYGYMVALTDLLGLLSDDHDVQPGWGQG